ncbi:hypothetical protein DYB28_009720 [Aphanomyces astaci]|uniref:PX domain-containing protein n=1 Tax=Aphanomyces astaci TaxID=112090 RepID=A0A9X8EEV6_APHAT|nr:hypothetical protein DYB28_009720 [Aphanomyces astaci]
MGQVVSCCLGTADAEPSHVFKRSARAPEQVPSTPSMSDSHFYQSLGEHEMFGNASSRVSHDGDLVDSLLSKKRATTMDSVTSSTPRTPYMSRFFDSFVATPRVPGVSAAATSVQSGSSIGGIPTLPYDDDADDERPDHVASSVSTDDTLEEQPAVDDSPPDAATSQDGDSSNNNTDPTLPDVLSIKTRTDHSFSSSSEHSIESNNQDDTPPGPFTVTVKRFFPIEDKFEFSVTVFDDELLNAGRHFDIIRDRLQVAKYNDALESHAAAVGVGCPSLPYTKKQDRQHGRALMDAYVQAIMQTPALRDARITLKYFHILKATTPSSLPSSSSKEMKKPTADKPLSAATRHMSGGARKGATPPHT